LEPFASEKEIHFSFVLCSQKGKEFDALNCISCTPTRQSTAASFPQLELPHCVLPLLGIISMHTTINMAAPVAQRSQQLIVTNDMGARLSVKARPNARLNACGCLG
jgi:hypothetical protein